MSELRVITKEDMELFLDERKNILANERKGTDHDISDQFPSSHFPAMPHMTYVFKNIDFFNIDLSNLELFRCLFINCNFPKKVITGDFLCSLFFKCKFEKCTYVNCDFTVASFDQCLFKESKFSFCRMDSKYYNCVLSHSVFDNCSWNDVYLDNTNYIKWCEFKNSNMSLFTNCEAFYSNFSICNKLVDCTPLNTKHDSVIRKFKKKNKISPSFEIVSSKVKSV